MNIKAVLEWNDYKIKIIKSLQRLQRSGFRHLHLLWHFIYKKWPIQSHASQDHMNKADKTRGRHTDVILRYTKSKRKAKLVAKTLVKIDPVQQMIRWQFKNWNLPNFANKLKKYIYIYNHQNLINNELSNCKNPHKPFTSSEYILGAVIHNTFLLFRSRWPIILANRSTIFTGQRWNIIEFFSPTESRRYWGYGGGGGGWEPPSGFSCPPQFFWQPSLNSPPYTILPKFFCHKKYICARARSRLIPHEGGLLRV